MNSFNYKVGTEAFLSLVFMAGVPVFIKYTNANPFTIGIVRLLIASFLIIGYMILTKEKIPLKGIYIRKLALIGFVFSIHWITYFYGIKIATASIGILGASTYGIHLIILGWIFLSAKPRVIDIFAILLAFFGTYIIIPEFSLENNITLGLILSIISGMFFALLPILHQKNQFISGSQRAFGQYIFAIPLFLLFFNKYDFDLQQNDWWSLLYLGIVGTFMAHSLWIRVTTKLHTAISSLIFYAIIPMTMSISYIWLGEDMSLNKIAGAIMIVSANIIGIMSRVYKNKVNIDPN